MIDTNDFLLEKKTEKLLFLVVQEVIEYTKVLNEDLEISNINIFSDFKHELMITEEEYICEIINNISNYLSNSDDEDLIFDEVNNRYFIMNSDDFFEAVYDGEIKNIWELFDFIRDSLYHQSGETSFLPLR